MDPRNANKLYVCFLYLMILVLETDQNRLSCIRWPRPWARMRALTHCLRRVNLPPIISLLMSQHRYDYLWYEFISTTYWCILNYDNSDKFLKINQLRRLLVRYPFTTNHLPRIWDFSRQIWSMTDTVMRLKLLEFTCYDWFIVAIWNMLLLWLVVSNNL